MLTSVANTVISELGLSVSAEDRAQIDAVLAQTPPIGTLSAVAEASLGLQTSNPSSLEVLGGDSSWTLSEQAEVLTQAGELDAALDASLQRYSSCARRHRSARSERCSPSSEW